VEHGMPRIDRYNHIASKVRCPQCGRRLRFHRIRTGQWRVECAFADDLAQATGGAHWVGPKARTEVEAWAKARTRLEVEKIVSYL